MGILYSCIALMVLVAILIFRSIYKHKYRFVDNKGDEITDQTIIAQKKKELGHEPLVQNRDEEMTSIAQ